MIDPFASAARLWASQAPAARGSTAPPVAEIVLDPEHPNRLLGTKLTSEEIVMLLSRVGVHARLDAQSQLRCSVPSWRNDLSIAEDLIEEIARIHGYDAIEPTMPRASLAPVSRAAPLVLLDRTRDLLKAAGLVEVRLMPTMQPSDLDALRLAADDTLRRSVRLANPMPGMGPLLCTSLLPGLLRAARRNLSRQVESVRIFEVGRVFLAREPGELPDEPVRAGVLVTRGERASLWEPASPAPVFFEAKGIAENLLDELGQRAEFRAGSSAPWLHPGASGELVRGSTVLCRLGEVHPGVAAAFELTAPCALLEVELSALLEVPAEPSRYREVSPYPAVRRDLAVLLEAAQPAGAVLEAIRKTAANMLVSAHIFDRYEGKGVPAGKVSIAFRLVFQRPDRTLLDAEVAKTTERVIEMLGQRFGGTLR